MRRSWPARRLGRTVHRPHPFTPYRLHWPRLRPTKRPVATSSPVDWGDGVTIAVEVALSSSTGAYGAWDSALWDAAAWGPDVLWTDVSQWVRAIDIDRRFSRDMQAWEAGTAGIVLDDRDGRFDPDNLAGPYVTSGITGVRPARPVRVRVTRDGVEEHLYRGYVRAWKEGWTIAGAGKGDAYTTMECTDEMGMLARFDGFEQPATGGGETTGRRIHRILDNAGHTGERCVDDGRMTCQPTTLAQNAVTELKRTADSEGGALWVEPDGCVTFEHCYALIENERSNTVQATWGDGGGAELPYSAIETADYDDDQLVNYVTFSREGGTMQVSTDETSRALYTTHLYPRTDLVCETDVQVKALADLHLLRYAAPERRIVSIEVRPRRDPDTLFAHVLGRRVRDLIRVIRRPPGGHTVTRDVFIAGIHHEIRPKSWVTQFGLWSATPYASFSTSRWDIGVWDTATFFN